MEAWALLTVIRAAATKDDTGCFRVLVTGSQTWPRPNVIEDVLAECAHEADAVGGMLLVVHGWAAGADATADAWALDHHKRGWPVARPERHPANWRGECREKCHPGHRRNHACEGGDACLCRKPHPDPRKWSSCPAAGYYRNEEMIVAGAHLCLAFIHDGSSGASHCLRLAKAAMIPTVAFAL